MKKTTNEDDINCDVDDGEVHDMTTTDDVDDGDLYGMKWHNNDVNGDVDEMTGYDKVNDGNVDEDDNSRRRSQLYKVTFSSIVYWSGNSQQLVSKGGYSTAGTHASGVPSNGDDSQQ